MTNYFFNVKEVYVVIIFILLVKLKGSNKVYHYQADNST